MSTWNELKKPINFISISLAILSIIVSVFLYIASLKSMEPVYQVDEHAGKIFDSSLTSPSIKVLDSEGKIINEDIYLSTVTIWNAGELPIEPKDVRKPFQIQLSNIKAILDFSIIKEVDKEISRFSLNKLNSNTIGISWQHLDPQQGIRVQIIYIGYREAVIDIKGKVITTDIKQINLTRPNPIIDSLVSIILFPLFCFSISFFFGYLDTNNSLSNKNKSVRILRLLLVLTSCVLLSYFVKSILTTLSVPSSPI